MDYIFKEMLNINNNTIEEMIYTNGYKDTELHFIVGYIINVGEIRYYYKDYDVALDRFWFYILKNDFLFLRRV